MIKAFLFDYDGVITKGVDVNIPAERLATNADISVDEAISAIKLIWNDYSTGIISKNDMWNIIEVKLGKQIPNNNRDIWFDWKDLQPIKSMIEVIEKLKAKGYPVGLLSNVFQETADLIRLNGGYDSFDFTILSSEVGARKPDPSIYQYAMQHLSGIEPNEVMFFDDRQHCIDGASEFGLNTYLVTNHTDAVLEVNRITNKNK